jgi:hypothetical protein
MDYEEVFVTSGVFWGEAYRFFHILACNSLHRKYILHHLYVVTCTSLSWRL